MATWGPRGSVPYMEALPDITNRIRTHARDAGFSRCGIASAGPFPETRHFFPWLEAGFHGEMDYLAKDPQRRADVTLVRGWTRSVIMLALDYHTDHPLSVDVPEVEGRGWISRYAWGRDYHAVIEKRLKRLVAALERDVGVPSEQFRYYVDHGPVLEKVVGHHAGLGWIGKNTLLIDPEHGSYFFLAAILTDLELPEDGPVTDHCGACTRCIDVCPTDALVEPWVLDARRCISYLTIEQAGEIPDVHREGVGRHVFGCDLCQDVCPWNAEVTLSEVEEFEPREGLFHPDLQELFALDAPGFQERFSVSPVKRRKQAGLKMNIRSAMKGQTRETTPPEEA